MAPHIGGNLVVASRAAILHYYAVPDWVSVPGAAWVDQQVHLDPHPKELMLRNHLQSYKP